MSFPRSIPVALVTTATLVLGSFLFSAAGGCQLLSGISDLEATGGADAVSSSSGKTTVTSSSMMMPTTGSGQVCDPIKTSQCIACGEEPVSNSCCPPYCDTPNAPACGECSVSCAGQQPNGGCDPNMTMSGPAPFCMPTTAAGGAAFTADTDVAKIHFKCSGTQCDGYTFRCSTMANTESGRIFPCLLECASGACKGTTLDCSLTAGTCTALCQGGGACEGLKVICGKNECKAECKQTQGMPPPLVTVTASEPKVCGDPIVTGCGQ